MRKLTSFKTFWKDCNFPRSQKCGRAVSGKNLTLSLIFLCWTVGGIKVPLHRILESFLTMQLAHTIVCGPGTPLWSSEESSPCVQTSKPRKVMAFLRRTYEKQQFFLTSQRTDKSSANRQNVNFIIDEGWIRSLACCEAQNSLMCHLQPSPDFDSTRWKV